jgi:hypothetical protein
MGKARSDFVALGASLARDVSHAVPNKNVESDMKRLLSLLVLGSIIASPAIAGAVVEKGKILFASGGTRLGIVYKVTQDGSAQIIFEGKLITIPASTITETAGRLETSLTKNQLS